MTIDKRSLINSGGGAATVTDPQLQMGDHNGATMTTSATPPLAARVTASV
jgi:hypothetical protein